MSVININTPRHFSPEDVLIIVLKAWLRLHSVNPRNLKEVMWYYSFSEGIIESFKDNSKLCKLRYFFPTDPLHS